MNARKLTTGFYRPTESYKSIPEHIAVCFEDDLTLVAVIGASDDDTDHVLESHQYAQLFAAAPETLQKLSHALDRIAELEAQRDNLANLLKQGEELVNEYAAETARLTAANESMQEDAVQNTFALNAFKASDKLATEQITALKQELDQIKSCKHMNVKIHSRLWRASTLEEPAEYEYKAECKDCGELFSADDVDEWAEVEE